MTLESVPSEPSSEAIAEFWQRFLAAENLSMSTDRFTAVECFGDTAQMADELLNLILNGPKRATASAAVEYEREGEPLPSIGERWIAYDGLSRPRAVIETTEVRVGPLSSVDAAFAWDEGEGDRSLDYWVRAHQGFFQRYLPTIGVAYNDDMSTVFERFRVAYAEDEQGNLLPSD